MTNEAVISNFLRTAYTDEKLAALLAHAEDGKLSYNSCCCLIGIPLATHALHSAMCACAEPHHNAARELIPNAGLAEGAFRALGADDVKRRARIIPLIRTEIERRESERSSSLHISEMVCV